MNLEQIIVNLVSKRSGTEPEQSNENKNNNNHIDADLEKERNRVDKCLREVCKNYKIACLIELLVFLLLMSIFIYFNMKEINAEEFWKINFTLEETLLKVKSSDFSSIDQITEINANIESLFNDVTKKVSYSYLFIF